MPLLQLNNQQQFGTYNAYTQTQAVVLYRNVAEVQFDLHGVSIDELVLLTGREYWQAWDQYRPQGDNLIQQWTVQTKAARNERAYLKGDLNGMMGTSTEFPTRTEQVIHRRDAIFLERMKPFLETGRCAVFVGTAHLLNLLPLLEGAGFTVRRSR